jgi:hypothetical protein
MIIWIIYCLFWKFVHLRYEFRLSVRKNCWFLRAWVWAHYQLLDPVLFIHNYWKYWKYWLVQFLPLFHQIFVLKNLLIQWRCHHSLQVSFQQSLNRWRLHLPYYVLDAYCFQCVSCATFFITKIDTLIFPSFVIYHSRVVWNCELLLKKIYKFFSS